MQQIYTPKQNYKVLVRTITYNQAKYITDTLDGVAMQQTNFPFVHYVIDDCSTDGEQEVIKAWLNGHCDMTKAEYIDLELANVIPVPHKTNTNLTFAIYLLKRNLWKEPELKGTLVKPWRDHCEYEALCEGDDYWIYPEKLQKQVDYMDRHPDHSLCFHAHADNNEGELTPVCRYSTDNFDCGLSEMIVIGGGYMATNSMFYRTNIIMLEKPEWYLKSPVGDLVMMFWLASHGKVAYLDEVMSVYRIASEGSWSVSMSKSWKRRNEFYSKDIWVHKEFDRWTNYKYHSKIVDKIIKIKN